MDSPGTHTCWLLSKSSRKVFFIKSYLQHLSFITALLLQLNKAVSLYIKLFHCDIHLEVIPSVVSMASTRYSSSTGQSFSCSRPQFIYSTLTLASSRGSSLSGTIATLESSANPLTSIAKSSKVNTKGKSQGVGGANAKNKQQTANNENTQSWLFAFTITCNVMIF